MTKELHGNQAHSLFDIGNDNGWDADLKVLLSDIPLETLLDRLLQKFLLEICPLDKKEGLSVDLSTIVANLIKRNTTC